MASAHPTILPADRDGATRVRLPGWSSWLILPILLVALCWAGWSIPLNNDISWQYWIARQMRGGATLYRDIVEVNPPLWFWEAMPISALADRLHVDAMHLVVVAVMARATLAVALTAGLIEGTPRRQAALLLVGLMLLLCLLPLHDFAEREHLMAIGALPYATLIARRRAARPVSPGLAALVGLFAACGFALKPHFALVPLALEAWLAWEMRRDWRAVRAETIALALVATLYGAALLIFAPDYLRVTLPLVRATYGAFSPPLLWVAAGQAWLPAWLVAALALALRHRALPAEARAAIVVAIALLAIYFVQGKGFPYHALPVSIALGWALLWALAEGGTVAANALRRPLVTLALVMLAANAASIGAFHPIRAGKATAALEGLPPGSSVAVIATHSWLAFPLIEQHRLLWPMRTMSLWMVPRIALHDDASTAPLRRQTLDRIASDLWCHPPQAILVDDPAHSPELAGTGFRYEAFLRADPRIRELLAYYRPWVVDGRTTVYARRAPLAPRGADCRAVSIRPDAS